MSEEEGLSEGSYAVLGSSDSGDGIIQLEGNMDDEEDEEVLQEIEDILTKAPCSQVLNLYQQLFDPTTGRRRINGYDMQSNSHFVGKLVSRHKLSRHAGCVNTISFSGCGKFLLSGSDDSSLCLWDVDQLQLRQRIEPGHTQNVFCAQFLGSSDRGSSVVGEEDVSRCLSCSRDGFVALSNVETGQVERTWTCNGAGATPELRRLGAFIGLDAVKRIAQWDQWTFVCCTEQGCVHWYDTRVDHAARCMRGSMCSSAAWRMPSLITPMYDVCVGRNNKNVHVAHGSKVKIFDARRWREPPMMQLGLEGVIDHVNVANDDDDDRIARRRLRIEGGVVVDNDEDDEDEDDEDFDGVHITGLALSRDESSLLASFGGDTSIIVRYDTRTGQVQSSYMGHENVDTVKGVRFGGPHDNWVLSGSDCGNAFIWDTQSEAVVSVFKGDSEITNCVTMHPNQLIVACSGLDNTIRMCYPEQKNQAQGPTYRRERMQAVVRANMVESRRIRREVENFFWASDDSDSEQLRHMMIESDEEENEDL